MGTTDGFTVTPPGDVGEMDHHPLSLSSQAVSERTGSVESDSEDRGRADGDRDNGTHAAPGPLRRNGGNCEHSGRTEHGCHVINVRGQAVLYVTFGRRGD